MLILSMATLIFSGCFGGNLVTPPTSTPVVRLVKPLDDYENNISQRFGNYLGYYGGKYYNGFHSGEDISVVAGTPVYAITSGWVAKISDLGALGHLVVLEHNKRPFKIPGRNEEIHGQNYHYPLEEVDTVYSVYVHVDPNNLSENDWVETGDEIADIADISAAGLGAHLHFEIRHPDQEPSSNWTMVGDPSNWSQFTDGTYNGYYKNLQEMVNAGFRHPSDFLGLASPTNTYTISWTTESPMLTPRSWAPAVQYGGKIYVVGGCSSSTPAQFYNAVATLEVYDPATDTWERLTSMSIPRIGPAVASLNGKIYVFGGFNRDTWSANDSVEVYDIATNIWTTGASIPTPRSWMKAVVLDNKIYVIGGVGYGYMQDVEVYDPTIDTWEIKSPILPRERYLHAVIAYNGKIYVIGGDSYEYGYDEVWNDIQEYDPITDIWAKKSPMPDSATGLDAVAINGKIYVFGGNGLARQYDIATDTWQELISNQDSVTSFSVCLYNNEVYRFGGGGWGPTSNIVQSADLR